MTSEKISTKKEMIFSEEKLKKHKKYFIFFLCLSILSVIDIGSRQSMTEKTGLDMGMISYYILIFFSLLSAALGSIIASVLNMVFSFAIMWIPITLVEYSQIKKLKKLKISQ